MACPSCGEPVTSDAFRCAHCGARLLLAPHDTTPAPKPNPVRAAAPAKPPPRTTPHHAPAAPPDLPVAPLQGAPRRPPPRRRALTTPAGPFRVRSIAKMSRLALASAVLIGVFVARAWNNDEFVGTSAQRSGFDTGVANAGASQPYTAPDGSFTVNFPGIPAEMPAGESQWNRVALRTQDVVATTSGPLTSRVRYADLDTSQSAMDLAEFYKSLCRSMGPRASDSSDVVAGEPALRCQIDDGTYIADHELLRHGSRIYDISSTYPNDDLSAADTHDSFVGSFQLNERAGG